MGALELGGTDLPNKCPCCHACYLLGDAASDAASVENLLSMMCYLIRGVWLSQRAEFLHHLVMFPNCALLSFISLFHNLLTRQQLWYQTLSPLKAAPARFLVCFCAASIGQIQHSKHHAHTQLVAPSSAPIFQAFCLP